MEIRYNIKAKNFSEVIKVIDELKLEAKRVHPLAKNDVENIKVKSGPIKLQENWEYKSFETLIPIIVSLSPTINRVAIDIWQDFILPKLKQKFPVIENG